MKNINEIIEEMLKDGTITLEEIKEEYKEQKKNRIFERPKDSRRDTSSFDRTCPHTRNFSRELGYA